MWVLRALVEAPPMVLTAPYTVLQHGHGDR